jgi:hypothetical protein
MFPNCLVPKPIVVLAGERSPVSISRGYSRLTLLGSEERMGVLLALVLVMQTDRGREILKERFTVGFDQRRKERAARFSGKRK